MALAIRRATKSQAKARIALIGVSGSGKTYTGLALAREFSQGGPILVIDTEHGSASKYADEFSFDVIELVSFAPQQYMDALDLAEKEDYPVVMVDSLSHAWAGKDGILEFVDLTTGRSSSRNTFSEGWRAASPLHNKLVERLLSLSERRHLIVTMRSKMAYIIETDGQGKQRPRKIGLQPVQREGVEYEFDIIGDLDLDNTLVVTKTRCKALNHAIIPMPGAALAAQILGWLKDGAPVDPSLSGPVLATGTAVVVPQVTEVHPTADQISSLVELAKACDLDLEAFGQDMRSLMKLSTQMKVTKKFLREEMSITQFEAAWLHYSERLKILVEEQVTAEDVIDYPPEATKEPVEATINDSPEGDAVVLEPDAEAHIQALREAQQAASVEMRTTFPTNLSWDLTGDRAPRLNGEFASELEMETLAKRAEFFGTQGFLGQLQLQHPKMQQRHYNEVWAALKNHRKVATADRVEG